MSDAKFVVTVKTQADFEFWLLIYYRNYNVYKKKTRNIIEHITRMLEFKIEIKEILMTFKDKELKIGKTLGLNDKK